MARQQAPERGFREAVLRDRARAQVRQPPPQTGLGIPPDLRPLLLHEHKAQGRRSHAQPVQPLRNPVCGIYKLYERAGRLPDASRGGIPLAGRQRGA